MYHYMDVPPTTNGYDRDFVYSGGWNSAVGIESRYCAHIIKPMTFSLRTLLLLAVAVASATLASRSTIVMQILAGLYHFSLLAALIAILYRSGRRRAF